MNLLIRARVRVRHRGITCFSLVKRPPRPSMSIANFAPDLSKPRDLSSLARALAISTDLFQEVISCEDPEQIYRLHRILKRAPPKISPTARPLFQGEIRVLSLPAPEEYRYVWESQRPALKLAHKSTCAAITGYLANRVADFPHANAYGFVRGRSTKGHATRHLGARELVSADIKNFFPSISVGRVEQALLSIGIDRNVSPLLARF